MTTMLTHYLSESCKGDRKAAYEAAKIMKFENYNEVLIQNQFRRSAELGYAPAQRELGILGLCSKLVEPTSSVGNISYYNDNFHQALIWLKQASKNLDGIAIYILGKCYQHNIGVSADEERSSKLFKLASELLPLDQMITINFATSLIVDTINTTQKEHPLYIEEELLELVG